MRLALIAGIFVSCFVSLTVASSGANERTAVHARSLTSVTVSPASVVGGSPSTGTVTLSSPAPEGGTVVRLTSSRASAVVPISITIPTRATNASFLIGTSPVSVNNAIRISAEAGTSTVSTTLTVLAPTLQGLSISPVSVIGGVDSTGTVTLDGPAPSAGTVVRMSSSNSNVKIPASVEVPANQASASFTLKTTAVSETIVSTITSKLGSVAQTATLAVTPATLSSLTVTPTSLVGGAPAAGVVTLTGAAGPSGAMVSLASSNPSAVVPPTVKIGAGDTSAQFAISTTSVTVSTPATISSTLGGSSLTASMVLTPLALVSIGLSPTAITGGAISTGTVVLNGPASGNGLAVSITSNSQAAQVPASISIPAGQSNATFSIDTASVLDSKIAAISATYNGVTVKALLTVNPATLLSIGLNPTSVNGGISSVGTVTLTGPAPISGLTVYLSSNENDATVPLNVKVPFGKSSATFPVKTIPLSVPIIATISAHQGEVTQTATLNINPAVLVLVTLNPTEVNGGTQAIGTVKISGPALKGGMAVALSSNQPSATMQPSVMILAGQTQASFLVHTKPVIAKTAATITATLNGNTETDILTIDAAQVKSVAVNPTSVQGGKEIVCTVSITTDAPVGGAPVQLSASKSAVSVPASVTIPAGKSEASFSITTSGVSTQTSVTITATLGASRKTAILTLKPAVITAFTLSPTTVSSGATSTGTLVLSGPAPILGAVVKVTSSKSSAGVPATVVVPAGQTSVTFLILTSSVTTQTIAKITASLAGVSKVASLTITK